MRATFIARFVCLAAVLVVAVLVVVDEICLFLWLMLIYVSNDVVDVGDVAVLVAVVAVIYVVMDRGLVRSWFGSLDVVADSSSSSRT